MPRTKNSLAVSIPTGANERAWQLAQLAALLSQKIYITAADGSGRTLEIIRGRSPEGDILNVFNRETVYEILLSEAGYLLNAAERKSHHQHAYQLFRDTPQWLAVDAIAKVFKQHNWKGLTSNQSVEALVSKIIRQIKEWDRHFRTRTGDDLIAHLPHKPMSENPLWVSANELVQKKSNKNRQVVKRYWADRLFLLAHLVAREKFATDLERTV